MKMSTKEFIEMIATPGSVIALIWCAAFVWIMIKIDSLGLDTGIRLVGVILAGGLSMTFALLWFIMMDLQALKIRSNELKKTV